jgi:teichuronic acid biosynthesis glycosyltransferase TuaH
MSETQPPYDVVVMTMSRWDGEVSSAILSLSRELARRRRVFYWDHPFSVRDLLSGWNSAALRARRSGLLRGALQVRRVEGMPEGFRAVTPPLTLPINWMKPGPAYEAGSAFNDRILNAALARLIRRERIGRYVFLNSFDPFFFRKLQQRTMPLLRIYQSRDDISQETYIARHGTYLEPEQLRAAGLRLATSRGLQARLHTEAYPVHCLPNAADTDLFAQAAQPGELPDDWPAGGNKPVMGYIGNFSSLRLDYPLLRQVINAHPDVDFVFIGTGKWEDPELEALPNVFLLGPRPLLSLPAYMRAMQGCLIPFLCNQLTSSIYPLKINEYLAAGKPVISTSFSEDVRDFAPVVHLAADAAAFSEAIHMALRHDSPDRQQERMAWAGRNSWAGRCAEFETLIAQHLAPEAI